jgi:hypothetical protein
VNTAGVKLESPVDNTNAGLPLTTAIGRVDLELSNRQTTRQR